MVSKDILISNRRGNQQELKNLFQNLKDIRWLIEEQKSIPISENDRYYLDLLFQKTYQRIVSFAREEVEGWKYSLMATNSSGDNKTLKESLINAIDLTENKN